MENLISIVIGAIFINNIVLTKFLGLCPFFGVSTKISNALSMGGAVTFVMTFSSIITWLVYDQLLIPFNIEYLRLVAFILVIATFVQLSETIIKNTAPKIHQSLGVYLPLITTNCAILGIVLINNIQQSYTLLSSTISGAATGAGFTLALLLMAGIRERLALANSPESLRGLPLAFIAAALLALAFQAFSGMSI
ncbi:electron transporter RnfA [candidate division MSBL1 archaeon SCGC-AAA382F02]|uniref:Ion-translocating oxidoreductase complex subunit A n=1 Tax=candidate division MSBL1 archaeon SCGC-AAA382F02 TaxID=1698282 RepID=A0A133VI32_9EURY|nr:electron transporter RnfA [candidate division MSBL1 archaeon SCGC-AAA382F02]